MAFISKNTYIFIDSNYIYLFLINYKYYLKKSEFSCEGYCKYLSKTFYFYILGSNPCPGTA